MAMRPLEPFELLERCDLAGEARVLALTPNPMGWGTVAKLEFTRIVKGCVTRLRNEWPDVALVETNREWRSPSDSNERHIQRFRKKPLNFTVVKLRSKLSKPPSKCILGSSSNDYYEAGTLVFTHLNWDPSKGIYRTAWWNAVSLLSQDYRPTPPTPRSSRSLNRTQMSGNR